MRVLIDACVLYPTVMREVVLGCAAAGLFEARWSERILEEWARATNKIGPGAEVQARGEIAMMAHKFPRAIVPAHPGLMQRLWLPDPDDVHVLAVAISGSADIILTMNAKDFPHNILKEEGLQRVDPDGFLMKLWNDDPTIVRNVVEAVVAEAQRLSGEDWSVRGLMKKARLPRIGKALM